MQTILDIFKTLMEEPHKLTRAMLAVLHWLFAIFLSISLYRWCFDKVTVSELSEWAFWRDWVLTQKVLIWIFLFMFSYWLLFSFLPILTVTPLEMLAGRPWHLRGNKSKKRQLVAFVFRWLSSFGLVEYDKQADHLKAGRHTGRLVDFLESLETATDQDEEEEAVLSTYLQGWHLFVLFSVCYFFSRLMTGHSALSVIIAVLLVALPAIYVFAMRLFYFISGRREQFLFLARGLLFDEKLESAMRLQGFPLNEKRSDDGRSCWRTLNYQGQEHHFFVYWTRGELTRNVMEGVLKIRMPPEGRLLMVTNQLPGAGVAELVDALEGRLTVLVIPGERDIQHVVKTCFKNASPTSYVI